MIQQKENNKLTNWEIVSVNPIDKVWSWKDLFCFWAINIQSVIGFSLITSLLLIYDLNFFVVLSGCFVSASLIYFLSNLISKPSQKHGLPFIVILRMSMGVFGAKYIGLLRGVVGIFMFGVQTFFISKSIGYLIRISIFNFDNSIMDQDIFLLFFMEMNVIDGFAFLFTLCLQYLLFSKGHKINKNFITFSALFVYFGLFIFFIMIIGENHNQLIQLIKQSFLIDNFYAKSNILPILTVAGTMFAYFSIIILNYGDFSRYVKNETEVKKGNFSIFLNLILFSSLAICIVLGADLILTKNLVNLDKLLTNPTDIISKFNNTFLTIVALIFILFSSLSSNLVANYIPSQNVLINFAPRLTLRSTGFLIILFSFFVGLFWLPILSQIGILSFIDTLGAFFGPIFGVIIADFYFIQKSKINNKDIFSTSPNAIYFYGNGWHYKSIYSTLIGFIFAASTIWNFNLMFLQSFSWIVGAIISFITYYLLANKE